MFKKEYLYYNYILFWENVHCLEKNTLLPLVLRLGGVVRLPLHVISTVGTTTF
jgi:hypothetical protein